MAAGQQNESSHLKLQSERENWEWTEDLRFQNPSSMPIIPNRPCTPSVSRLQPRWVSRIQIHVSIRDILIKTRTLQVS